LLGIDGADGFVAHVPFTTQISRFVSFHTMIFQTCVGPYKLTFIK